MINVSHLTKCYGSFKAVDDLSFEIENGQVYGLLGPNGAGKSTTMNIMTGCLSPTEGSVSIDGHDILEEPERARRLIGYLPEIPPLYTSDTTYEYLKFVGEAKGLKGAELKTQIDEVMEKTGITAMRDRLISALSKGYRQRVGIAQALLGDPELIILDEPTVGLDPIQIIEIRDLIRSLGASHTVILSSHILSEVQAVCQKVLIISRGRLIAYDTPDNLEHIMTGSGEISLKARASKAEADAIMSAIPMISEWSAVISETASVSAAVCSGNHSDSYINKGMKEKIPDTSIDAVISENSTGSSSASSAAASDAVCTADAARSYVAVTARTTGGDLDDICCQLFTAFAERKLPIFELSSHKANLEEVFLELTSAAPEENAGFSDHDNGETAVDISAASCAETKGETVAAAAAKAKAEIDSDISGEISISSNNETSDTGAAAAISDNATESEADAK